MVEKARWAAAAFSSYSRDEVLKITQAAAEAGAAGARKYAEWAVAETGFGNADHKEIKNRLCSIGLFEHYKGWNFTDFRIDHEAKIVEIPKPAGVDLRADAVDEPGLLGLLQGDHRASHAQRHRHLPPPLRQSLLRRCGAAAGPRRRGGRRAGRGDPGHRRAIAADHRFDHEVGPHRPDPGDRRHGDGAGGLFVRQPGDRGRARQQPRLCGRERRPGQGSEAHRQLQGVRQFHPLHRTSRRSSRTPRSPSGLPKS